VELINPSENWALISANDICSIDGESIRSGFSYAAFENIEIKSESIEFDFNYFPKATPGEYIRSCSVAIARARIESAICGEPRIVD
jgi:hypothetical protein